MNALIVLTILATSGQSSREVCFGDAETPTATASGDRLPYKITAHVAIAPEARIDSRGRDLLLDAWRGLLGRFVGAPWDLTVAEGDGAIIGVDLATIEPDSLADLARDVDKVWLFRLDRVGSSLVLNGREFDAGTRRLGPTCRRSTKAADDLPRALLNLALDVFRPSATLGDQSGGGVVLTVRGGAIRPASPAGQVVKPGTVFRPIRLVTLPGGERKVLDVPFTYLRVESVDGPLARCAIISALRDPLTRRVAQKNQLVALGSRPGPHSTRLRFLTQPDGGPAAGYLLTARSLPDGLAREVGTTDREGRIVFDPPPSDSGELLSLRLLGGSVEPLVEFPLMPGESDQERTLPPLDPKHATIALETELDTLRDAVIDLVAVRARLEARLKARFDGEDWEGVEAALGEFSRLPPHTNFVAELARLKENAAQRQVREKAPVLTRTAMSQINEVDSLIARYLDDEVVRAYTESLAKVKADAAARSKQAGKAKK